MEYRKIKSAGFEVYADAYIAQPVSAVENKVFFISLIGTPTQVTAVSSTLFQGSSAKLINGDEELPLKLPKERIISAGRKISNTLHRILRSEYHFSSQKRPPDNDNVLESKVVYGRTLDEVKRQAFLRFDGSVSLPLLADWSDWLWDEVFILHRLDSFGLEEFKEAWLISWESEEQIQELLLEAVRNRIIH